MKYTHQGLYEFKDQYAYPGYVGGRKYWNRDQIKNELRFIKAFQDTYQLPIYVGEFSSARWAQGGNQYLEDAISIFEEHGWIWTYHSYYLQRTRNDPNDSRPWDATYTTDFNNRVPSYERTQRESLLRRWFSNPS